MVSRPLIQMMRYAFNSCKKTDMTDGDQVIDAFRVYQASRIHSDSYTTQRKQITTNNTTVSVGLHQLKVQLIQ